MNWRTEVSVNRYSPLIDHSSGVIFVGSCFSEHLAGIMQQQMFCVHTGAHGILFHPHALHRALQRICSGKRYGPEDWILSGDRYVSLEHHGRFSGTDAEACAAEANRWLDDAHRFISKAVYLFITYGSAVGYWYKQQDLPVANCHKLPQQDFEKRISDVEELAGFGKDIIGNLLHTFPQLHIVSTVSPVRHWRDGAVINQRSKSRLILLCEELERNFDRFSYFPVYEMIMDDLRDYRFYAEDLIHPSGSAVEYVRTRFFEAFVSEKAKEVCRLIQPWLKKMEHRGIHETPTDEEKRKAESLQAIRLIMEKAYTS